MTITFKTTPNTSKFRENMSLKGVFYLKYSRTYLLVSLFLFVTGIVVGYMLELYSTAFVMLSISMLLFIYATYTACVEENISRLNVTVFLIVTIISMMLALMIDVVENPRFNNKVSAILDRVDGRFPLHDNKMLKTIQHV